MVTATTPHMADKNTAHPVPNTTVKMVHTKEVLAWKAGLANFLIPASPSVACWK